jgi:hypothetical protein
LKVAALEIVKRCSGTYSNVGRLAEMSSPSH